MSIFDSLKQTATDVVKNVAQQATNESQTFTFQALPESLEVATSNIQSSDASLQCPNHFFPL